MNQLGKFSPDYSMIMTKIRTLLKTGVKFDWTPEHQEEFNKITKSLSSLEKLEPYNPDNHLFALVDASLMGLGFILFQKTIRVGLVFYRLAPLPLSMPKSDGPSLSLSY